MDTDSKEVSVLSGCGGTDSSREFRWTHQYEEFLLYPSQILELRAREMAQQLGALAALPRPQV